MTALDIIVLFLIGAGAVFGFMRGFVQEALSLIAWVLIIAAIRLLHGPVSGWLTEPVGTEAGAAVLAFIAIVIVTYALGRLIAKKLGEKSRKSVLGPVDRVLGFGFGAVKGLIGATLIFLFLVMAYETAFGGKAERPEWMTGSRTYPLLNASGDALSTFIRERQEEGGVESEGAP
jgi:membrane protein required for colicin V production